MRCDYERRNGFLLTVYMKRLSLVIHKRTWIEEVLLLSALTISTLLFFPFYSPRYDVWWMPSPWRFIGTERYATAVAPLKIWRRGVSSKIFISFSCKEHDCFAPTKREVSDLLLESCRSLLKEISLSSKMRFHDKAISQEFLKTLSALLQALVTTKKLIGWEIESLISQSKTSALQMYLQRDVLLI